MRWLKPYQVMLLLLLCQESFADEVTRILLEICFTSPERYEWLGTNLKSQVQSLATPAKALQVRRIE